MKEWFRIAGVVTLLVMAFVTGMCTGEFHAVKCARPSYVEDGNFYTIEFDGEVFTYE